LSFQNKQEKDYSMNTFALDKNYDQFNFEQISVAELEVISGGSGGSGAFPNQCVQGTLNGAAMGAAIGSAMGAGMGAIGSAVGGAIGTAVGAAVGAAASCG
jgi:hypothetical protein